MDNEFLNAAKVLWKNDKGEPYYTLCDYTPILESFGKIVSRWDQDDYQGDSVVFLENKGSLGLLIFGWGSCSGCDALQSCSSVEELGRLLDGLSNSIKWFDNSQDAILYFKQKDWEGTHLWNQEGFQEYLKEAEKFLLSYQFNKTLDKIIED